MQSLSEITKNQFSAPTIVPTTKHSSFPALPRPSFENTPPSTPLIGRVKKDAKRTRDEILPSTETEQKKEKLESHPFDELAPYVIDYYKASSKTSHILTSDTFFINEEAFPLINCGEGEFHKLFRFRDENRTFVMNDHKLNTSEIVLKFYKSEAKKEKAERIITNDIEAYKILKRKGVPLPLCYVSEETLQKKSAPFMLLERMIEPITGDGWMLADSFETLSDKDKKVLEFAKRFLTLNAWEYHLNKTEFLGDFNPKNVMLNSQGEPVVVDPTLPESGRWLVLENMKSNIKLWSRENPVIIEYLVNGFPGILKQEF